MDVRLGRLDKFLLISALVGMIAFGALTMNASFVRGLIVASENKEELGSVDWVRNDVRRRLGRSLAWFELDSAETLYESDSIFTGNNSQASLTLSNGIELTVAPNSLVILTRKDNELQLDLQLGSAKAELAKGTSLQVRQNNSTARLVPSTQKASLRLERRTTGDLTVSASQPVKVNMGKAKAKQLEPVEMLKIDQQAEWQTEILDLNLLSPKDFTEVWVEPTKDVTFFWSDPQPRPNLWLEVSTDRTFQVKEVEASVDGKSEARLKLKGNHLYHWRVVEKREGQIKPRSATESFYLLAESPPRAVFPLENFRVIQSKQQTVDFRWRHSTQASSFHIQVSRDHEFREIVAEKENISSDRVALAMVPGSYYWRVRVMAAPVADLWSAPIYFSVIDENLKSQPLPPPVEAQPLAATPSEPSMASPEISTASSLEEPVQAEASPATTEGENVAEAESEPPVPVAAPTAPIYNSPKKPHVLRFSKSTDPRQPASVSERPLNPVKFVWKPVVGADKYELLIDSKKDFKAPLVTRKLEQLEMSWQPPHPGRYFWKVRAEGKEGAVGPFGPTAEINVALPAPHHKGSSEFELKVKKYSEIEQPVKVPLKWEPLPLAKAYSVQIAKDENFEKSKWEQETTEPETELSIPTPGDYYVRMAALDGGRRLASDYSKPMKVKVRKVLELGSPQVSSPGNGSVFVQFDKDTKTLVEFGWKKVVEAEKYRIQLSNDPNFSKTQFETMAKGQQFLLEKNLPEGQFYWRVRAERGEFSSDWSEPRTFVIKSQ